MLPNITIMAPGDATELKMMFDYAYKNISTPIAIRYPKDIAEVSQLDNYHPIIEDNPYIYIKEGSDILIIVVGPYVRYAKECVNILSKNSINPG